VNQAVLFAVATLGFIGIASAAILYVVAQKFKVIEDPRIDEVANALPGANCGGCGFAGCRNFAESIVKTGSLDNLNCPVGGRTVMTQVAAVMGLVAEEKDPMVAVLRCNGSFAHSPKKVVYDGALNCQFANALYNGESGCPHGCLGLGDCVASCTFDAMYIDETTGLPVIIEDKCTSCGACVKACPRHIIELRKKGPKSRRIFVSCVNTEKGAIARKNCEVACIGCGKCVKVCNFEAITMENNLAYINFEKCTLCRKCVEECPTNAIQEINFKPRAPKQPTGVQEEVVA
jgi:Na+-translocating ferredoxin:NAD+ oxidoreductase RNF subunit RnfB